ncbi:MAG: PEGA domain-containing protein [Bacteroidota bacterium]
MKRLIPLFVIAFTLLTGCATVFTPNKSRLTVYNGYPKNAKVYLNNEYLGEAPLEIWVENHKLDKENLIEIKSEGFETAKIDLDLKTDAAYFIADMVSIVGLGIDYYTGAIYKPKPGNIKYKLREAESETGY